jgi:hypothetical protein
LLGVSDLIRGDYRGGNDRNKDKKFLREHGKIVSGYSGFIALGIAQAMQRGQSCNDRNHEIVFDRTRRPSAALDGRP